jgi:cytochrome o ubiquinol oxidase operon protein cyoD
MGVHVAFFLYISSASDQALALAFGVFVTGLIVFGSIMIMAITTTTWCRWTS